MWPPPQEEKKKEENEIKQKTSHTTLFLCDSSSRPPSRRAGKGGARLISDTAQTRRADGRRLVATADKMAVKSLFHFPKNILNI